MKPESTARLSEAHAPETNNEKKVKEELTCNLPSSKWIGGIEVLQGNIRKGLKNKKKPNEEILLCIKGKNEALVFLDSRLLVFETKSAFLQSGVKNALSYNYSDIRKIGTVKVKSLQSSITIELNNGNSINKIQLGPLKEKTFQKYLDELNRLVSTKYSCKRLLAKPDGFTKHYRAFLEKKTETFIRSIQFGLVFIVIYIGYSFLISLPGASVDINNNVASCDVVLSTLHSKENAAYRLCDMAYNIAKDHEGISAIRLKVYMDKDNISDEYGNKPDSNKYMGEVRIDDPYYYRRFESNPYHTNIQVAGKFLAEVNKLDYSYLLRK